MIELNRIYNEDCLEGMKRIPDKSIDMILCDLPYGTTHNKWDSIIPLEPLWEQYKRIIKDNGAIVLFGQGKFTAEMMLSEPKLHRYNLIWDKVLPSGFLNANLMPLRSHEDIMVFYKKLPQYNPQKTLGKKNHSKGVKKENENNNYGEFGFVDNSEKLGDMKHPKSIITFSKPHPSVSVHPTQKPVELCEYLIKTYTNEGETVLDNCMGSGTTAIACINTNRNYIGFELDKHYCDIANERIQKALAEKEVGE
jgi:site-specific DNA-methyltransferase (adenine-specific)